MPARQKPDMPPGLPPEGFRLMAIIAFAGLVLIDLMIGIMLYSTYAQTMSVGTHVYLCDLPLAGFVFCAVGPDMSAMHLLALLMAVFSIFVPMMIWSEALRIGIFEDPEGWLALPGSKLKATLALAVLGVVVLVELVNMQTLITQESLPGPFDLPGETQDNWAEYLATNRGLALFVSVLIVIMNLVLALITVRAARGLSATYQG